MEQLNIPNLTDMDSDDLDDFSHTLRLLQAYIHVTKRARAARLSGRIASALTLEAYAQRTYQKLPAEARW